jgi:ABC-type antimicrobial peptide transport system permease subunit
MFKFNFLFAIRHLLRNKTYSILNLLGLTIGLSCAILLFTDVLYDLSYDKFHTNYRRLYNLNSWMPDGTHRSNGNGWHSALFGPMLKSQMPEVEDFTRLENAQYIFKAADRAFVENGFYADENFFSTFSFTLKEGNVKTMLKDNNAIIISERMAKKFFDNSNCVGKTLILKNDHKLDNFLVTGVMKDVPDQSTLNFDFIIPFSRLLADYGKANELTSESNTTWLLMKPNIDLQQINSRINKIIDKEIVVKNKKYFLFPLKDKHLYNYMNGQKNNFGSIIDVLSFSTIAVLILLIACFNFMNLAIALTSKRYGEAGIKKALGSARENIIFQFLGESIIISLISLCFAFFIVAWVLPAFNSFSPVQRILTIPFSNPAAMFVFIGIAIFAGLLAGIYPALLLSSVRALNILKRNVSLKGKLSYFRQGLIVFQFIISIFFITFTFIFLKQANYIQTKDLGLNKENILVFENHENIQNHQTTFKSELLSMPEVSVVCFSNSKPFQNVNVHANVDWPGRIPTIDNNFPVISTDCDYLKTLQPKLLKGRFFDQTLKTDEDNFVINETAAEVIKQTNPVGQILTVNGQKGTIIGVVKNFQTNSLFDPYFPVIIKINPQETYFTVIKFLPGDHKKFVETLRKKYKQFESDYPFEPELTSDIYYRENFKSEAAVLIGIFAAVAIFLACLGLYGLAAYSAEKRTKEIGVRKINGAATSGIILLLLRSYAKWIAIAICIGVPITFLLGNAFLGSFAFHTSIPLWAFVAGPLIVLSIALLTVSWLTFKAASRNPVESLRYE